MEELSESERVDTYKQLSLYLTQAFLFMNEYAWISNSYVAEFFTQQLWLKLPYSWRKCLENASLDEVAVNALKEGGVKQYGAVWPLSLLAFVSTCHSLALNRTQKKPKCDLGSPMQIPNVFEKHIKPKKRHELSVLPEVIHNVCKRVGAKNIVDVGSGLGHLSRFLAFKYGYKVTAIEMTGQRLPTAEKFDKEMKEMLKHIVKDKELHNFGNVTHVAKKIDCDITSKEFCTLIGHPVNNFDDSIGDRSKYVLVGLHTCGDLASTMLNVFKNTPQIAGVVSVSCCYFRMTLKDDSHHCNSELSLHVKDDSTLRGKGLHQLFNDFSLTSLNSLKSKLLTPVSNCILTGICRSNADTTEKHSLNGRHDKGSYQLSFPLSQFLRNIPCQPMKYKSFETACHFIDDYAEKLQNGSPNLKLHCYRAVMEVLLRKIDPKLVLAAIRCKKIKNAASMSFSEYAEKVFERLDIAFDSQMLSLIDCERLLSQWRCVAIYHSFSLLLGPVIESIALVDKWMYLLESDFNVALVPLFDPKISPRNFVVIGTRNHLKDKI